MFNDPRFIYLHTGILHTNNLSVKNIVPKAEVDVVHISSGAPLLRIDGAVLFIRYVVSSLKVISTDTFSRSGNHVLSASPMAGQFKRS